MIDTQHHNYHRIEQAIDYIQAHYKRQPSLDEISAAMNISPSHFQRIFSEWAGVSPKKFIQYLSIEYAKALLVNERRTLADVAHDTGFTGTARLHDLFIRVEGMTPGEFKLGGKNLVINYSFHQSIFGKIIIASTHKGVCHLSFQDNETLALSILQGCFPKANYRYHIDDFQESALSVFQYDWQQLDQIKLHLKATDFQLKVWEALLCIPLGQLQSYGDVANMIDKPRASRAVGTAIGRNPVAFLIPCHRVIQGSGQIGGYMWGITRKLAMIGWEASKI